MDQVHFLQGGGGAWTWEVRATNGATLARSGQAYHNERAARLGFGKLLRVVAPMVGMLDRPL